MGKRVIIIASGQTERLSLPHLMAHLREMGLSVGDVRIPPHNRELSVEMAEKLIKAAWYEDTVSHPDKFVIVLDTNGAAADEVLSQFSEDLPRRLTGDVKAVVQYAYARRHLEAWYFADAKNLRAYLGRDLGNIDTSKPDDLENPKLHLNNLLGSRVYTARVAAEIAEALRASTMIQRSPSFRGFLEAVMNGQPCGGNDVP